MDNQAAVLVVLEEMAIHFQPAFPARLDFWRRILFQAPA